MLRLLPAVLSVVRTEPTLRHRFGGGPRTGQHIWSQDADSQIPATPPEGEVSAWRSDFFFCFGIKCTGLAFGFDRCLYSCSIFVRVEVQSRNHSGECGFMVLMSQSKL